MPWIVLARFGGFRPFPTRFRLQFFDFSGFWGHFFRVFQTPIVRLVVLGAFFVLSKRLGFGVFFLLGGGRFVFLLLVRGGESTGNPEKG